MPSHHAEDAHNQRAPPAEQIKQKAQKHVYVFVCVPCEQLCKTVTVIRALSDPNRRTKKKKQSTRTNTRMCCAVGLYDHKCARRRREREKEQKAVLLLKTSSGTPVRGETKHYFMWLLIYFVLCVCVLCYGWKQRDTLYGCSR